MSVYIDPCLLIYFTVWREREGGGEMKRETESYSSGSRYHSYTEEETVPVLLQWRNCCIRYPSTPEDRVCFCFPSRVDRLIQIALSGKYHRFYLPWRWKYTEKPWKLASMSISSQSLCLHIYIYMAFDMLFWMNIDEAACHKYWSVKK